MHSEAGWAQERTKGQASSLHGGNTADRAIKARLTVRMILHGIILLLFMPSSHDHSTISIWKRGRWGGGGGCLAAALLLAEKGREVKRKKHLNLKGKNKIYKNAQGSCYSSGAPEQVVC